MIELVNTVNIIAGTDIELYILYDDNNKLCVIMDGWYKNGELISYNRVTYDTKNNEEKMKFGEFNDNTNKAWYFSIGDDDKSYVYFIKGSFQMEIHAKQRITK